jgi:hypothetical protein
MIVCAAYRRDVSLTDIPKSLPARRNDTIETMAIDRIELKKLQRGCDSSNLLSRKFPANLPPWGCGWFASARPNYDSYNVILRGRACVIQIAILTIQLIENVAESGADPAVIESADDKRGAVCEGEAFRCFINP